MKCPTCGFENPKAYGPCQRCGRFLSAFTIQTPKTGDTFSKRPQFDVSKETSFPGRPKEDFSHEDIAKKMKMYYQHGTRDTSQRTLEILLKILDHGKKRELDSRSMVQEAAELIHDHFRLRWVAIGLKSPRDGLYRYEALVGFREEALAARRVQVFKLEDFTDDTRYKGRVISDYSKMHFEEDKPYAEGSETTFNRPALLRARRHSPDDALEADYLNVNIFGVDKELVGWIETSGTIMGKLPEAGTIKAIEVIGSMLGTSLSRAKK